jgi:hypothetical protein
MEKKLMMIIERLMEMNCPALYIDQKYFFIYKNYVIKLNEYNIWLGDDCYTIPRETYTSYYSVGRNFYVKVQQYARKKLDINQLEVMIDKDFRKQKLEKINIVIE